MKQERHRQGESERRLHRALALFTAIQCWMRCLDGVVFTERQLLRILGLKDRIVARRREWLFEDFGDYFLYRKMTMWHGKTDEKGQLNSFCSLWVCRRFIPQEVMAGVLSDEERLKRIASSGPHIAFFEIWPDASSPDISRTTPDARLFLGTEGNYDEKLLASYLSLLCQGLISPKSVPSLQFDFDDDEFLNYGRD